MKEIRQSAIVIARVRQPSRDMLRRRLRAVLTLAIASVGGLSIAQSAMSSPPTLRSSCTDADPCHYRAGTYRLGAALVLPGLQLTLPAGWRSTEATNAELKLIPPGPDDEELHLWVDMLPVKSSGPGHGSPLKGVGTTPNAIVSWLTGNPDFLITSKPLSVTIAGDVHATRLTLAVSNTANYGDPGCPDNPHCADLFTTPRWGNTVYGIGGKNEVQLYLATISIRGKSHTMLIDFDGANHAKLMRIVRLATPILAAMRLPR